MGSFQVWEVMSQLNHRTSLGRVVINPPTRMPPIALKKGADKWYLCKCGRGFKEESKYIEHKNTHPKNFQVDWTPQPMASKEETLHSCMHCGKVLQTATALRNHIYIHTGEKPWQCEKCPAVFRLYSTLYDHRKTSHVTGGKFKCPQCPCRFAAPLGLKRHIGIYHPKLNLEAVNKVPKKGKGVLVGAQQQTARRGRVTVSVVGADGSRSYPCTYCGKVFYKSQYLRNHLPVHTGERRSVCHLCGVGFKSSSNLLAHKKVSHVEGGKHKCERCTCVFASLLGLVRHRRLLHGIGKTPLFAQKVKKAKMRAPAHFLAGLTSDGTDNEEEADENEEDSAPAEESYECEECGKVLASAAGLRNHLMIHSGEKPWICNICGLSFRLNSTLYGHKKTSHVPNGQFKCDICPCKFAAQFGLRRHKICFHDAAEPPAVKSPAIAVEGSKCQYCDKVFKTSNILQTHIELVHQNEETEVTAETQCPKCNQIFTTKGSLKKHYKTAHVPGGKKCPKCPCSFATTQAVTAHHTKVHIAGKLTAQQTPRKSVVVSSSNGDSTADELSCPRCGKSFLADASLKNHLRYCSQQNIKCELCEEKFSIHSNMIRHLRSCHVPNGPYKCNHPQCTHSYATTRGISRHLAHAHGEFSRERNPKIWKKSSSGQQSKPAQAIQRLIQNSKIREANARIRRPYQRIPDALRKHKCSICGNAFTSIGNYNKHLQTSHVPGGKYPCQSCACVFNTYNALNSHTGNRHRKALPEEMEVQSPNMISIKRPLPLSRSMPPLSKIKFNFLRPNVTLSLKSPSPSVAPPTPVLKRKPSELLKRMALIVGGSSPPHESSREDSPPPIPSPTVELKELPSPLSFDLPDDGIPKCPVCEKVYSNMSTLRNHMTVHTGEKNWPCDLCGQRFRQKGDVYSHQKTNHSDGKYKCGFCPCRFVSTQGFKRHMQQIHGRQAGDKLQSRVPSSVQVLPKPVKGIPLSALMKVEKKEPAEFRKVTLTFASDQPKHKNPLSNERKYNCDLCDASFNHAQNLMRHKKSSHVPWGEFKCPTCSCCFVSSTSLRTHQAIFHQPSKRNPNFGGGRIKQETRVVAPAAVSKPLPALTKMSSTGEPIDHLKEMRVPTLMKGKGGKKTYACELCGACFNSHGNCTKHITNSHVNGGNYVCPWCPCIFSNFKGLARHESIYHAGGNKGAKKQVALHKKKFRVEVEEAVAEAEQYFEDDDNIDNLNHTYEDEEDEMISDNEHTQPSELFESHFEEEEEECLIIPGHEATVEEVDPLDTSSNQEEEEEESQRDHDIPMVTPKIEATSLSFEEQEEDFDPFLEANQLKTTSLARLKVEADLAKHEEKSNGRPKGAVFGDVGVLQKERVNRFSIYAKKEQHVCKVCNMAFSQLGGLKGHMRIHTGDKPFQCRLCGICFRLNSTMAVHIKKCHSESNPFQCEYCSCQFVTSGVLTQHIYKHHPEKSEESLDEV